MHRNLDMKLIVSPVNVRVFEDLLVESKYDMDEIEFLIDGFNNGFDIHYTGPVNRQDTVPNLPFQVGIGDKFDMWEKIMEEVKCKRYTGPFDEIPFQNFIQSLIGLVPKARGKTRLIFHLSYNFKKSGHMSVNHHTPREFCTVKYPDLNDAISNSFYWKRTTGQVFYSKTDLKSAFRILLLKFRCLKWLILKAYNPITGKVAYFIEKNLLFGHSISCSHFQRFSNALKHIMEYKMSMTLFATNYLDDFLFISSKLESCNKLVSEFLHLCELIRVPVALEKTEWASSIIVFLGLLLDGNKFVIAIPEEKCIRALNWLMSLTDKKKATVNELESLTGLLNFLNHAVFPGRAFTRRMYAKFTNQTQNLKQYHHIRLDREFKDDCKMWQRFLSDTNTYSVAHPFVDHKLPEETAEQLYFSDASKNGLLGLGAIFNQNWLYTQWEPGFIDRFDPSIEFLELYALCMGVFTWAHKLRNRRFILYCDNTSSVNMINGNSSGCKYCMTLIRKVTLKGLEMNFRLFADHVEGKKNKLSDSLSRLKIKRFKRLA